MSSVLFHEFDPFPWVWTFFWEFSKFCKIHKFSEVHKICELWEIHKFCNHRSGTGCAIDHQAVRKIVLSIACFAYSSTIFIIISFVVLLSLSQPKSFTFSFPSRGGASEQLHDPTCQVKPWHYSMTKRQKRKNKGSCEKNRSISQSSLLIPIYIWNILQILRKGMAQKKPNQWRIQKQIKFIIRKMKQCIIQEESALTFYRFL